MTTYSYRMLSMPYANAHVEFILENDTHLSLIRLFSYSTLMLELELDEITFDGALKICHDVNCSMTTARHVNRFTTELFGKNKYHELKEHTVGDRIICADIIDEALDLFEMYVRNGRVY